VQVLEELMFCGYQFTCAAGGVRTSGGRRRNADADRTRVDSVGAAGKRDRQRSDIHVRASAGRRPPAETIFTMDATRQRDDPLPATRGARRSRTNTANDDG
jgi:hypothetical protein